MWLPMGQHVKRAYQMVVFAVCLLWLISTGPSGKERCPQSNRICNLVRVHLAVL